ncbi:MAG: hypothetical protein RL215_2619, partial [Planctomycetota bacterium]
PVRLGLAVPERTESAEALLMALAAAETVQCLDLGVAGADVAGVDAAIENAQNSGRYDLILRLPPQFSEQPSIQLITDGQNAMATAIVTAQLKEYYAKQQMDEAAAAVERLVPETVRGPKSPSPATGGSASSVSADESLVFSRPTAADEVFRVPTEEVFLEEQSGGLITVWDPPALELQLRPDARLADGDLPGPAPDSAANGNGVADASLASETAIELPSPNAGFPVRKEVPIEVVNPQAGGRTNPRIAMYAAGVAVLFLLFACTGHAGTMLEEAESGTLDRILASHAGLLQILAGKWLGIFLMGCLQLSVMFVFAELVFGIELAEHWQGFLVMAACTSAATSGFALFLATMCRSRAQLNALATVIILSMSAIGGSMIPRFVMSERMKELGRFSFNAWALDGFQKVFWFRVPVSELKAETAVLLGSALVMGILTIAFSGRWKRGI